MADNTRQLDSKSPLQLSFYSSFLIPSHLQLLDDDGIVIGELHSNCISDELIPAMTEGAGLDYLELEQRSPDELPELIGKDPPLHLRFSLG